MEEQSKENEKVLSDEILADARRRAERMASRAEAEARKLVEESVAQARAVADAEARDVEAKLARERQVFDASLRLEERMRRLAVQGRLIDEAFAKALERLRSREGYDYRAVLRRFAVEAIASMRGDAFVLHLARADHDAMRGALPAETAAAVRETSGRAVTVTAAERPGPFEGGLVVESADGRQRVDSSFAGRLRRMRDDLRFDVADVLFGEQGPAGEQAKAEPRSSKSG